jgi:hypothetical protein
MYVKHYGMLRAAYLKAQEPRAATSSNDQRPAKNKGSVVHITLLKIKHIRRCHKKCNNLFVFFKIWKVLKLIKTIN